jgi:polysaccharide export outer membrane protein
LRSAYILGPDDQLTVQALHIAEINDKPVRIDMAGNIRLPLVGQVRAAGLTVEQLENELTAKLKTIVQEPEVTVGIAEFKSQPVSVMGAVKTPGVYQVQGRKNLIEVLSASGGLEQDAGDSVRITRRKEWGAVPLPGAHPDASGQFSVAEVNLRELMQAKDPLLNIEIQPQDVVTVPRASLVYVMGEVRKPGGFTLRDKETVSILQALSMSEGLGPMAAAKNARILRATDGKAQRQEIPVDLKQILAGRAEDIALRPDDILFVPNSASKSAFTRGLQAALEMGTGVVVWRRF